MDPLRSVTQNGYCSGCGACACMPNSPISIAMSNTGQYIAQVPKSLSPEDERTIARVCPFSDVSLNEDQIAGGLYADGCKYDRSIGYYRAIYTGHVNSGTYRMSGSSGGITSWLLAELLKLREIDAVLHVVSVPPSDNNKLLFRYGLSADERAIRNNAKSRYYPIEFSQVIKKVLETSGRYAFVGLPCFVRAIRLLQEQLPVLKERIVFVLSLFCGHLKSTGFAKAFAWQMGIQPDGLMHIDFRTKLENESASSYAVTAIGVVGGKLVERTLPTALLYGNDWGIGLFKYKACDYCDDIVGETADISMGDAWLSEYTSDWRGANIVVSRHPRIDNILTIAASQSQLALTAARPDDVVRSQLGNYRHRREFLGYRLAQARSSGKWHPPKRFGDRTTFPHFVRRQQDLRMQIAKESHRAFKAALDQGNFDLLRADLDPLFSEYRRISNPLWLRFIRYSWRAMKWVVKRVPVESMFGKVVAKTRFHLAQRFTAVTGRRV